MSEDQSVKTEKEKSDIDRPWHSDASPDDFDAEEQKSAGQKDSKSRESGPGGEVKKGQKEIGHGTGDRNVMNESNPNKS